MSDVYALQQLRAAQIRAELSKLRAREQYDSDREQYARDLAVVDRVEAQRIATTGMNRKQRRAWFAQQRRLEGRRTP